MAVSENAGVLFLGFPVQRVLQIWSLCLCQGPSCVRNSHLIYVLEHACTSSRLKALRLETEESGLNATKRGAEMLLLDSSFMAE